MKKRTVKNKNYFSEVKLSKVRKFINVHTKVAK